MKIDRAAFLVLTSAIAAGGCTIVDNTGNRADTGTPVDTGTAETATADTADTGVGDALDAAPLDADSSDAPVCDDSIGAPGDCTAIAPSDEGTCGTDLFARDHCGAYKATFKPKVAQAAVACLLKLTAIEVCNSTNVYKCGHDALLAACPDATAASSCDAIIAGCAEAGVAPTAEECAKILAGLNSAGRAAMVDCMKTGCFTGGLYSCEEGL